MTKSDTSSVAILGGGILGMTLAHRLSLQGQPTVLFEESESLGGLAGTWSLGDFIWDKHYHVILLSDCNLRSLLAELGLEHEIQWVETHTGFFVKGRLYSMSNTVEFLRFPPLGVVDRLRLGLTILVASRTKNWRRLEGILATEWLRKWSGIRAAEKIWLPLLRAKLGENYKIVSASFIWAIIARMYAARRSGLKKEMFGYVPGGYGTILQRFAELLVREKVEIRSGYRAVRVEREKQGKVGVLFANGYRRTFDRVVLTMPAGIACDLCQDLTEYERERFKNIQYQGVICASLVIKNPLTRFYVTNLIDSWVPFTAIIEMSNLVDRGQFRGSSLVYLPKYVTPEDPLFSVSDQKIEETFLNSLERMFPSFNRGQVLAFRISRVPYVLPVPTLHYSRNLPPVATSMPGVYIINSAQIVNGTLNANETVQLANNSISYLIPQTGNSKVAKTRKLERP